jgi:hypothetical protein
MPCNYKFANSLEQAKALLEKLGINVEFSGCDEKNNK